MNRRTALRLAGAATLLPAGVARAQAFPARPMTIVVGFPPGTASDTVSRFLADRMGRSLGQPVTVENRPGVDGSLAAAAIARMRPDGYSMLHSSSSAHAANLSLFRNPGYDPVADFTPLGGVLRQPTVVLVRDIAALVALSQRSAAGLTHGFGNASTRIVGEMLHRRGGLRTTGVSFRGNPQSLTELIAGRLDFAVADAFTGTAQVRAGTLRALAVSGEAPAPALPDVPSLVATGVLANPIVAWTALFAPAGLPAPIRATLHGAMAAAMTGPDWDALMDRLVAEPYPLSGEALGALVRADVARWAEYVRIAGIEPQ